MKIRDIIKIIELDGWFMVRMRGSHRQFKHKNKKGVVTIAGHLNDELAKGTLNSILKQAGLKHGREKSV
ncbi:MAG: type II toxin-antitoxin system HicA family toxin [Candidatus Aminicenantes bacterium]|nr:type II toxin-antitoxin system HicA family toxin [Candidatus Aminicenantes bacterium]MDH5705662.1 type II toxin-antitoxin system HicA family toxin [Candidatus Aminicenantes bacterium]